MNQADARAVGQAIAQMNVVHVALFFSLVDAVLSPEKPDCAQIAAWVRENYKHLGGNESADLIIGFIVRKLEEAPGANRAAV